MEQSRNGEKKRKRRPGGEGDSPEEEATKTERANDTFGRVQNAGRRGGGQPKFSCRTEPFMKEHFLFSPAFPSPPLPCSFLSSGIFLFLIITLHQGMLMRSYGLRVTTIKIDPYLNIDAGTMSPFEHGEVQLPLLPSPSLLQ